jgi:hypothetical protein
MLSSSWICVKFTAEIGFIKVDRGSRSDSRQYKCSEKSLKLDYLKLPLPTLFILKVLKMRFPDRP